MWALLRVYVSSLRRGHTPIGFSALAVAPNVLASVARRATMPEAAHPDIAGDSWIGVSRPSGIAVPRESGIGQSATYGDA